MKIVRVLRMLRRWFTPPGNRGAFDSSYRQPTITTHDTNIASPMAQHDTFPPS